MNRKRCPLCKCACIIACKEMNPGGVCCTCYDMWCIQISKKEAETKLIENRSRCCDACGMMNACQCLGKKCHQCGIWVCDQCVETFGQNTVCATCSGNDCPICMEFISDRCNVTSKKRKRQTICGHTFHSGCINEWSRKSSNCPICQQELFCRRTRAINLSDVTIVDV